VPESNTSPINPTRNRKNIEVSGTVALSWTMSPRWMQSLHPQHQQSRSLSFHSDFVNFTSNNNPTLVYKKDLSSSKSPIHRVLKESAKGHRLIWGRVGAHFWGPHGGSIITSNKGLHGWQIEVVILPTTAIAKALLHTRDSERFPQSGGAVSQLPIWWGNHEASNQIEQSQSLQ
jgi:hypothetical protein